MSQHRGTTTDQLSNVIQVIQLGRKTGLLKIERGDGTVREGGEVVFVGGQITEARSGQATGERALSWLNTWGACRFIFIPAAQGGGTRGVAELSPMSPNLLKETNPYLRNIPLQLTERGNTGPLRAVSGTTGPRRTRQADEGLYLLTKAGLSRVHRHLFLLIDGKRTREELVRLMGKSPEDIQKLLRELASIGIIQQ